MRSPLIVLKFGGSVLRGPQDLAQAAHEVYRWTRRGWRVVAVVSAFEGATDSLLAAARALSAASHPQADATLLATGELTTAAQLCLALTRAGIGSRLLTPHCLSLRARPDAPPDDADPHSVDADALRAALERCPAVVVPGFVAAAPDGSYCLLGRGGSDLTALFLASHLAADRCRLIKDVDGLYERDPAATASAPPPRRFRTLHWSRALALDAGIIQPKAVRLALDRALTFEVGAFHRDDPTVVGDLPNSFHDHAPHPPTAAPDPTRTPLRVALLGCGTIGAGVLAHLARTPGVRVTSVLVRSPHHARERFADALRALHARPPHHPHPPLDIPHVPFTTDADLALDDADVVVDALPGVEPARSLLRLALSRGIHAVSANKALVAEHSHELRALARPAPGASTPRLLASACVGGGAPMLETIARLRRNASPVTLEGVVSATANLILDRLRLDPAASLHDAVRSAQALGLAEPDPTRDLDASDTRAKLRLLCLAAFDAEPDSIINDAVADLRDPALPDLLANLPPGAALRLVARAELHPQPSALAAHQSIHRNGPRRDHEAWDEQKDTTPGGRTERTETGGRIVASVRLAVLLPGHPLHDVPGDTNRLIVTDDAGVAHDCTGVGAGRWPTAESIIADVLDLLREHHARAEPVPTDDPSHAGPTPLTSRARGHARARLLPSARLPCS